MSGTGKESQMYCLLFPLYVRYVIKVCKCPIRTSLNFKDFAKKLIFTFNMVLTLFILLYIYIKCMHSTKQTSNTLRMYMLVYYQFNTCSALYHYLLSQFHIYYTTFGYKQLNILWSNTQWSFEPWPWTQQSNLFTRHSGLYNLPSK